MTEGDSRHARALTQPPVNFWLIGQESPAVQRREGYTAASVRGHPGKMLPALASRLIEAYTRPGDWILDPMSGIGTVGVEAIRRGRHYVGIELEERFVAWQRENLGRASQRGARGRFAVYPGDARRLDPLWPERDPRNRPLDPAEGWGMVDAVLTSPPYGDRLGIAHQGGLSPFVRKLLQEGKTRPGFVPGIYGPGRENIGNLKGAAYLAAMRPVYAGCYDVLRPGGLLVVVIRAARERHCLRPLHHDTARLCQEIGFDFIDEIIAIFSRVVAEPGKSPQVFAHSHFWRRLGIAQLRAQGWPVTLEQFEYVLVFHKPASASARRSIHKSGLSAALAVPSPRPSD